MKKKSKPRVVLVNPGRDPSVPAVHPPMNLAMIASFLERHGVRPALVDEQAGENVERRLRQLKPEIVGITATTPMAPWAYRAAKIARGLGALTVMGGKHASALPEDAAKYVDIVVVGEGEKVMLDIICGRKKGKIITVKDYIKNLDDIPPPAWHLFDMEFYLKGRDRAPRSHLYFFPPRTRVGSLLTSRGCPFNCIFCYNSWRGTPVRYHSAKRIINDVEFLIKEYKVEGIYFMDDNFFFPQKRFIKICEGILRKKFNILWGCQTRADSVSREILKLAYKSGLRSILFGFESGSQRILTMLKGKGPTIEQNCEAIRLCWETGVGPLGSFMVGSPTETIEDLEKTLAFVKSHRFDHVGIHITTPYPGAWLWKWCQKKKLLPKKIDWSNLTMAKKTTPFCNDTIPPEVIKKYRDEMDYIGAPLKPSQIFDRLKGDPQLLMIALKNPGEAISYVSNIFRNKLTFLKKEES